jgi:hypothetical protein
MKKIVLILPLVLFLSCCGVRESQEDSAKWKSDLQARIAMKDSTIQMYQDSLRECQEGNRQLHHEYFEKK